jgi:CubicO group peptidase (beta-lactamase class C family)
MIIDKRITEIMTRFAILLAAALATYAAPRTSMLVQGEWLAGHLNDPALVILHVGAQRDFDAGHIPGARLVTLGDISVTDGSGLRLELPPVAKLEEAFGKLGVSDTSRMVLYAGTESVQSATRVWFTLDYLGLGDHAALLDGGLPLWRASGRAVTTQVSAVHPGKFTAHPSSQVVVDAEWVRAHRGDAGVQLVDARLPEFYSGASAGGMPRAGHIPGARSVPYSSLVGKDGKLQGLEALGAQAALTVSYCHIGQQATVIYFAARYLGLDARLYDGSFQDWSRHSELPVERAEAVDKLDAIFAPLATDKTPGLAVLVRQNGHTTFERGYGVRDLRSNAKIDAQTDFRLASFTKQFTAIAIMLLVHDGKLSYDLKLTDIFPDFPAWASTITVRHLLTHTGGLPDYEDAMGEGWTATRQIQDAEVLDVLKRKIAPKFAAGTNWAYSNSGYVVLGLIVAKVSGQSYGDFLHDRIFAPLQMGSTLAFVDGRNSVPNRAFGHSKKGQEFVETDQSSTSATLGDGGVYSNLTDLAKWDEALEKHTLLSSQEMAAALTPATLAGGGATKGASYGFGWFLDPYQEHPRMWHSGSTIGFRTVIHRFTSDGLTVIVLANRTDLDAVSLGQAAADVLMRNR